MEKYKFITEYTYNNKRYGSEIFAESLEEAERILKSRKVTETILGYDPEKIYVIQSSCFPEDI